MKRAGQGYPRSGAPHYRQFNLEGGLGHQSMIPVSCRGSARPVVISPLLDRKDLKCIFRERIAHRPAIAVRLDEPIGIESLQVPGSRRAGDPGVVGYL